MQRLLTTSVLGLVVAALAMPAGAQTVFTEGFEIADGHTVGNDIIAANGWFEDSINNATHPVVAASAPGLSGQVGDGSATGTTGGVAIANPAGIGGGPSAGQELVLSFQWLVNSGELTGSAGFGFDGTRMGFDLPRVDNGTMINIADNADTDTKYPLPVGGGAEQVLDLKIVTNATTTQFFMNDVLLQTSPSDGVSGTFSGINGICWGCSNEPSRGCGIIDNIRVVVPEPASLGLLALGGSALLRRRRA